MGGWKFEKVQEGGERWERKKVRDSHKIIMCMKTKRERKRKRKKARERER
jgi:hypothetical protein